ncbi:hypothetical protein PABG_12546 [Paracoccidioides brasiliensis Pb03]|nr:hypothetical protein PABG_12546 [Paracoccidioides brasiliensis Pb03]
MREEENPKKPRKPRNQKTKKPKRHDSDRQRQFPPRSRIKQLQTGTDRQRRAQVQTVTVSYSQLQTGTGAKDGSILLLYLYYLYLSELSLHAAGGVQWQNRDCAHPTVATKPTVEPGLTHELGGIFPHCLCSASASASRGAIPRLVLGSRRGHVTGIIQQHVPRRRQARLNRRAEGRMRTFDEKRKVEMVMRSDEK